MTIDRHVLQREVLLAFWKVHILHHASEAPIIGNWMLKELRSHGYDVSPGTLYPMLKRMVEHGWLTCEPQGSGARAPRRYQATALGREVLATIRTQMAELIREVNPAHEPPAPHRRKTGGPRSSP